MRNITGGMVGYFYICRRKLWLSSQGISLEDGYEAVDEGKAIERTTYTRSLKNIMLDSTINIDFVDSKKIVHEIKKSDAMEESSTWQVKYYLYYLKNRGYDGLTGEIHYPTQNKITKVVLTSEDEEELERVLLEIKMILAASDPPAFEKKKICKSCAYFEFCMS